jgi:hypothetical protein
LRAVEEKSMKGYPCGCDHLLWHGLPARGRWIFITFARSH